NAVDVGHHVADALVNPVPDDAEVGSAVESEGAWSEDVPRRGGVGRGDHPTSSRARVIVWGAGDVLHEVARRCASLGPRIDLLPGEGFQLGLVVDDRGTQGVLTFRDGAVVRGMRRDLESARVRGGEILDRRPVDPRVARV